MRILGIITILCIFALPSEGKSLLDNNYRGIWHPSSGETREEWLRCHGFSCKIWDNTRRKLHELKTMLATASNKTREPVNDTDDSLDGCIWLTEDQLDVMLFKMKNKTKDKDKNRPNQGADNTPRQEHGNRNQQKDTSHGRYKRKVTDFKLEPFKKWPAKQIYWKFDGEHNEAERAIIRGAFSHWQEQTCLRFYELYPNEPFVDHHILVTRKITGCHSFIGRITEIPQQLNLQTECLYNLGTPVHEIGHALGLWHEQQRSDRDSAVRVLLDNIGYYVGQFYLEPTDNVTPYDYGSVMHYGPKAGSINGENTIETLNPLYQHNIGQRTGLSFLDAKAINLVYCQDACDVPLTGCQHGGYQDPNDCSRCKCPDGLSGMFCEKVAPPENAACGGDMTISSIPLYIESPGYKQGPYSNHITCSWRVKTTDGSHISLKFEGEFAVYAYYQQQCHHWVEVRYKQDIGSQGPRFCGYSLPNVTVISETDEMLIVFKTNWTDFGIYSRIGFRAKLEKVEPRITLAPTTLTPSTTTTTTVSSTTSNTARNNDCDTADLVLVMDSSSGVMQDNWPKILQFANNIISQFDVSPLGVHVGVITYASQATVSLPLASLDTISAVTHNIDAIQFLGGATNTHVGLSMMRAEFKSFGRPNAKRIAILITDGQTAIPSSAIDEGSLARSEGIQLYAAGVGEHFEYAEAVDIVGDKKHVLQIESFQDLVSTIFNYGASVHEMTCSEDIIQTSELSWSCDFEDDDSPFCGMIQDQSIDQFDWTRHSGRTPSGSTGPDKAFNGVHYAYIEASYPRMPDDEAVLYLPSFNVEGKHCFSFAYNMYGFHIRTLQIAKKTPSGSIVPLWLLTGEQGRSWQKADILINLYKDDQIMIIGKRGAAYSGDIAIDDLWIRGGQC